LNSQDLIGVLVFNSPKHIFNPNLGRRNRERFIDLPEKKKGPKNCLIDNVRAFSVVTKIWSWFIYSKRAHLHWKLKNQRKHLQLVSLHRTIPVPFRCVDRCSHQRGSMFCTYCKK